MVDLDFGMEAVNDFLQTGMILIFIQDWLLQASYFVLKLPLGSHQFANFILQQLAHFIVQFLLILYLPLKIFNLDIVGFGHGWWHVADNRSLFRILLRILLWSFGFGFGRFHFCAHNFVLQDLILFFFGDNNVAFWLIPDVEAFNFVFLALLYVLEGKEGLLTNQTNLFICPYFLWVFSLFLNFILKLHDGMLEVILVVLTFLGGL